MNTPTPTPSGALTADACLNPTLTAVGTVVEITYEETSSDGSIDVVDRSYTMTREVLFGGNYTVERELRNSFVYLLTEPENQRRLNYGFRIPGVVTCSYDPAIEIQYGLSPDETFAQTVTQSCSDEHTEQQSFSSTYLGRERVTVPAGTFDTCLFRKSNSLNVGKTSDQWEAVGSGIQIQRVDNDGFTSVLIDGAINGESIAEN